MSKAHFNIHVVLEDSCLDYAAHLCNREIYTFLTMHLLVMCTNFNHFLQVASWYVNELEDHVCSFSGQG